MTVELRDASGAEGTDTTDSDGRYEFTVTPGGWTVVVTDAGGALSGYQTTTPVSKDVSMSLANADGSDTDFGYRMAASFGGSVWSDDDGDGVRDQGEGGVERATDPARTRRFLSGRNSIQIERRGKRPYWDFGIGLPTLPNRPCRTDPVRDC